MNKVMSRSKAFYIYLLGLYYIHTVDALKITSLDVPKTAWDAVKLNCKYDVEGGTLYAVKWYKDQREFLRCSADGSVKEFPIKDISIYHTGRSQIGSCFFELTALTSKSGGTYTCEVSLDWPTFEYVSKSARLDVIEPSRIIQSQETTSTEGSSVLSGSSSIQSPFLICIFILLFLLIL